MITFSKQKGFSLVEAVIYLAIVGILLTAVVSLHITLGGTGDKLTSNILVSRNRRVALNSVDYLVTNSEGLLKDLMGDCSDFSSTPQSLALYFKDDTYLPGSCVENGGGVRISVGDKKLKLTCYPNMAGNGHYKNCDTSTYPAKNIYYLSSPDVLVLNNSLSFSTSTATSTANTYVSVSTKLEITTPYNNQVHLSATSTATTTTVIKNKQASGLISWWKMENPPGLYYDNQDKGNNDFACTGYTELTGLVNGSSAAMDLNGSSDFCYNISAHWINFNNSFSITTWLEADSTGVDRSIVSKQSTSTYEGYSLSVDNGYAMLRICDGNVCADYNSSTLMSIDTVYNVAATYDLDKDEIVIYTYAKGGAQASSTFSSIKNLINSSTFILGYAGGGAGYFDGTLDDIRMYNRALSSEEVWAIESQGF